MGTLAGKLGDSVFWRSRGQQRVRAYVPRSVSDVNYQAAKRQALFANMKSIYQWLPEPFKEASNLFRVGGNRYADFMRQYNMFDAPRDKAGFGSGRFLPVEAKLSNGTWGTRIYDYMTQVRALGVGDPQPVVQGIPLRLTGDAAGSDAWGDWSLQLIRQYSWLRNGDKMHVLLAWLRFDEDDWGMQDSALGFPFEYKYQIFKTLVIDEFTVAPISQMTDGMLTAGYVEEDDENIQALCIHPWVLRPQDYIWVSVVGAIMFERPGATRQQRFSPSTLVFDRSQLMILSPAGRSRWNEFAIRSFMTI